MKNGLIEIETDRLRLRQWKATDFEVYAKYYSNESLAKYVGGRIGKEMAWRKMASLIGHWYLMGFGYWAVEEKESKNFVGCVGLWKSEPWPEVELGYWILPKMYGKGYATEAGIASKNFAFEELGLSALVSYIAPDNEPSKRTAVKIGAAYETTIDLLNFGPHCVYRYDNEEYR